MFHVRISKDLPRAVPFGNFFTHHLAGYTTTVPALLIVNC